LKISTKGRYALRMMLDLAQNYDRGYIPLKEISERQDISGKYMEQIVAQLAKAGFLKSVRGAQGGYMLAKRPEQYTVGMILRQMEGSLSPVRCVDSEDVCERKEGCVTVEVWRKIKEAVDGVVDTITLTDLMNDCEKKNGKASLFKETKHEKNLRG